MTPESTSLSAAAPPCAVAFDPKALEALCRVIGRAKGYRLLSEGVEAYSRYCDEMQSSPRPDGSSDLIRAYAHKVMGSAGTLGLRRVAMVAAWIEEAATAGAETPTLVRQLREAIDATRCELRALGILHP